MKLHKIHVLRVIAEFLIWELVKFLSPPDPEAPEIDVVVIMPAYQSKRCVPELSGNPALPKKRKSRVLISVGLGKPRKDLA